MYTSAKPYFYGTGRRKSSIARVRLYPGSGKITINGRDVEDYFGLETLKLVINQPFGVTETVGKYDIVANVTGGGISGQAGAIRHGVARALLLADDTFRAPLKKAGLLTRDPRMRKERSTVSRPLVVHPSSPRDKFIPNGYYFQKLCQNLRCHTVRRFFRFGFKFSIAKKLPLVQV